MPGQMRWGNLALTALSGALALALVQASLQEAELCTEGSCPAAGTAGAEPEDYKDYQSLLQARHQLDRKAATNPDQPAAAASEALVSETEEHTAAEEETEGSFEVQLVGEGDLRKPAAGTATKDGQVSKPVSPAGAEKAPAKKTAAAKTRAEATARATANARAGTADRKTARKGRKKEKAAALLEEPALEPSEASEDLATEGGGIEALISETEELSETEEETEDSSAVPLIGEGGLSRTLKKPAADGAPKDGKAAGKAKNLQAPAGAAKAAKGTPKATQKAATQKAATQKTAKPAQKRRTRKQAKPAQLTALEEEVVMEPGRQLHLDSSLP